MTLFLLTALYLLVTGGLLERVIVETVITGRLEGYIISWMLMVLLVFNPLVAWGQPDPAGEFCLGDIIGLGQWRIEKQKFQHLCIKALSSWLRSKPGTPRNLDDQVDAFVPTDHFMIRAGPTELKKLEFPTDGCEPFAGCADRDLPDLQEFCRSRELSVRSSCSCCSDDKPVEAEIVARPRSVVAPLAPPV